MKTQSGTTLALGVATLFAAACDPAPEAKPSPEPATEKSAAKGKATTAEMGAAAKASGHMGTPSTAEAAPTTVNCLGIHECKGKSACHVKDGHACAGQNDCKGKGWIPVPEAECEAKGGKIVES